jgi:hypothetical protein
MSENAKQHFATAIGCLMVGSVLWLAVNGRLGVCLWGAEAGRVFVGSTWSEACSAPIGQEP